MKAKSIIEQALQKAKKNGVRGRALRREINKDFPLYGHKRSKYPYRVWLEELDAVMHKELFGVSQVVLRLDFGTEGLSS